MKKILKSFSENVPDAYGFGHYNFYRDVVENLMRKKNFQSTFKNVKKL